MKHRSYSSKASYGEIGCIWLCWIFKITARRGTSKHRQYEHCNLVLVMGTLDMGLGRNKTRWINVCWPARASNIAIVNCSSAIQCNKGTPMQAEAIAKIQAELNSKASGGKTGTRRGQRLFLCFPEQHHGAEKQ